MKEILLAPNSFKECADSVKAANIFSSYLSEMKGISVISKPISDGGDGFLNVCCLNFELEKLVYEIPAPFEHSNINCEVGYDGNGKKIYIESANILGMKIIPKDKRHPMLMSSKGMGVLLKKIIADIDRGEIDVNKVIIGIGGTGTNDMGMGLLSELGLKLCDEKGREINPLPINFLSAKYIIWKKIKLPFNIELISDVNNILLGVNGASYTFGKQKGLNGKEIITAESGFTNLIKIIKNSSIIIPGFLSGAGGGLAAGFQIFLNANMVFADKFITDSLKLNSSAKYSAVIIGEGAFDKQSLMNKGTGAVIKLFTGTNIPIILCCGKIDQEVLPNLPVNVYPISLTDYFENEQDSINYFEKGIGMACEEIKKILP